MTLPRHFGRAALLCGLALLAGCGPSSPRRMAVHGTVTYRGLLLPEGTIQFEPLDASSGYSAGGRIQDGAYSIAARQGLLPGRYRVQISSPDRSGRKPPPDSSPGAVFLALERLPEQYNTKSRLTAEVTARGSNRLDFLLD